MLNNLLTNVSEKTRMVEIPEAALYALLGFCIVFVGIAFLIAVVWAVGKVMSANKGEKPAPKQTAASIPTPTPAAAPVVQSDEVDEETVAVITAALMAYYQKTNPACGFTVKRIKRI
jgi:sodium pump decarboxylase gamma subunit